MVSFSSFCKRISGIMVSMLASSALDHKLEPQLGLTKDQETGVSASLLSTTALRSISKNKDWLSRNPYYVSE